MARKQVVSISLDPDVVSELDAMAASASLSRSAFISLLLRGATGHAGDVGELITAMSGAAFKGIEDAEDERRTFANTLASSLQ